MEAIHKTLVIRFSSIGDIVLASPLLRQLRLKFPHGQIDFATRREYAELVRHNHNLNYTYEFDATEGFAGLRRLKHRIAGEHYDLIVDIHNSLRSRFLRGVRNVRHVVTVDKRVLERTALVKFKKNFYTSIVPVADRYLETVARWGIVNDGKGLELHIPDEVLFGVNGRMVALKLHRFEKVYGFCPTARHATKRWPPERYAELGIRLIRETSGAVVLFGGLADRSVNGGIARSIAASTHAERVIDLTGELSLLENAAAMEYVEAIVTNDSGLMHIAAARRKPLVAIFGSTVREFGFSPTNPEATVLERSGLSCRPCSHIGRASCPEGHFRCMLETSVDEVFAAVQNRVKLAVA
ncbi:MAG: lipopolysaccharide heptosyltransferase II [Ignavibacteria bacterium GWA2_55_11]|nr:MAG: lipopolysaccharide heptosyltransferase II [Ignavibacteria bacterium GWA2_55_11]OGU75509.1 MAG: lipopolysaccharide heptosyltransferase II [Ignavibacteria bacterium RIFCSPLOWO2_12_FULL_56_21]HAV24357.1 lipopolysaccharide heptosyltransferase II [Bacteroidota bacterium]